jgi:hypothetical protein
LPSPAKDAAVGPNRLGGDGSAFTNDELRGLRRGPEVELLFFGSAASGSGSRWIAAADATAE